MEIFMKFCPNCAILLDLEAASGDRTTRFSCPVCSYFYPINEKIVQKIPLKKKEGEPIYKEDDLKYDPKIKVNCPKCHNEEAYFKQVQTRPTNELMTVLYKCCNDKCGHIWRED